tara:strand:- start:355 stop:483 length:129 start_codon:yes stop_codon:yes gene_type:complete
MLDKQSVHPDIDQKISLGQDYRLRNSENVKKSQKAADFTCRK